MNISSSGRLDLSQGRYVLADAGAKRVQRGDVLFNNTNSPRWVGKSALVESDLDLAYSNHMTRLRVPRDLDARLLALALQHLQEQGHFEAICSNHVNQASISTSRLMSVVIPVPPAAVQLELVEMLDEQLGRLDAANHELVIVERRIALFVAALYAGAVEGENQPKALASLAIGSGYGTSIKCEADGQGAVVLRIPNVTDGKVDLGNLKRAVDQSVDLSRRMLAGGDLLIVRTNGSLDLIGRAAVVPDDVEASFASYLIRYQLDREVVRPEWVQAVLSSPAARAQMQRDAATSAGQYNLSLGKLDPLPIPLPSLDEQDRRLAILERGLESAAQLRASVDRAKRRSKGLRRALFTAAFSGQLTGHSSDADRIEELADATQPE